MPIIEIDKSVFQEIENAIEQRDKMYEDSIVKTKILTDGIEKLYEQEVKTLRNQLQQKENIIKEAIEYIENKNKYLDKENYYQVFEYRDMYLIPLLDILKGSDKE